MRAYSIGYTVVFMTTRATQINLRLSAAERDELAEVAAQSGETVSAWARRVLLVEARKLGCTTGTKTGTRPSHARRDSRK